MPLKVQPASWISSLILLMGLFAGVFSSPARADVTGVGLGAADNFAVLDIGGSSSSSTSLFSVYQSATVINGNVGEGPFSTWGHGIDATINGTLYYDTTDTAPIVTGTITGGLVQQSMNTIVNDAINASTAAAALTPTQTFATLTSGQTIVGNGGLNVIRVTGDVGLSGGSTTLNLQGGASDQFVFQFTASDATSVHELTLSGVTMTLTGAISPDNIVWDLNGVGGNVVISSGAQVYGTFLAPDRGITVDQGIIQGQVIGGGGPDSHSNYVTVHSSSQISVPTVPEPSFLAFLILGFISIVLVVRKRTAQGG